MFFEPPIELRGIREMKACQELPPVELDGFLRPSRVCRLLERGRIAPEQLPIDSDLFVPPADDHSLT